ncbi:TauD/TfdA family dioxygenase [Micromonospora sp. NPDC006766]|uniref:TauD/TfdA family dioxygenase n=1 Tax=Micromonospora sp. NPDC006766 TaxID=3154778 RepID=UPI0033F1AA89
MGTIEAARSWLEDAHDEVRAALDAHGVLFLRGLPLRGVEDFAVIRDAVVSSRAPYQEKATPRSDFGDDVFSSTDLPPAQRIRQHNENSYTITFPGTLMFACLIAPEWGGATPTADCRRVLEFIPDDLARRFREHGWILRRNYSEHLSLPWRTSFGTDSAEEIERYCAANLIGCEWGQDGTLHTTQLRPAVLHHPRTSEAVWFNHVAFWNRYSLDESIREVLESDLGEDGLPFATMLGDGTTLTRDEVDAINAAYDKATVRESWQPGDLMIVDNILASHGREAFQGDRRILVAMGDAVEITACRPTVAAATGPKS